MPRTSNDLQIVNSQEVQATVLPAVLPVVADVEVQTTQVSSAGSDKPSVAPVVGKVTYLLLVGTRLALALPSKLRRGGQSDK